ncbi:MAG TPA: hypothetical protein DCE56_33780 [Cyanobacteria bacterium UBA8553]|nr:hypothetical protein [Cyanobacteria bacterium UBA8553]HAJ58194.1 hypothetical protein [Cyanobacteria bacterium UBA8543]
MKTKLGKLVTFLACTIALLIFFYSVSYSGSTTAQPAFISNLPAGYTAYSGQLTMGKSCTCATGGISGAPPPPPFCGTSFCFGSSNTRYGSISTNVAGITSTICGRGAGPPCFQLDGDDALVISGSMSPVQNLTYYSFTAYQSFTYNPKLPSNYDEIRTSINLGLNNANLKIGSDGRYVLILTANTNTLNVLKNSLRATGISDGVINTYLIPASVANVGTASYPDQLSLYLRLTVQSEVEKQQVEAFVKQTAPATQVLFIKGPGVNGDATFNDIPNWEDTLRVNNIEYRTGLDQRLIELEQAVTNLYAQKGYRLKARLTESFNHTDADECRTKFSNCNYNAPDALYTSFLCDISPISVRTGICNFKLGANSDDVLMLLGVNHSLVGAKTLAAFIAEESRTTPASDSKDGTFAFVGLYTQDSANQYFVRKNRRQDSKLYAVKIARSCNNELYCVAIPYLGGTPEKTGFYITGRIYLDKVTGSGPNPANLVPSVLLWLTRS